MRTHLLFTALLGVLSTSVMVSAAEDKTVSKPLTAAIQIKSGVLFAIPLTDGTTAPARCELIDGKARLTYIHKNQFIDLLITPWGSLPDPQPDPQPDPNNPYKPSPDYQVFCTPLTTYTLTKEDAIVLAKLYGDLAAEFKTEACTIKTSDGLRQVIIERGKPLSLKGKYKGLKEEMEKVLIGVLTLDVYELNKDKTADLLNTMAWAVYESGRAK